MNDTAINYQQLLTETLQKQMVILGPTITLAKAKHVTGLHITADGRVTGIDGNPQEVSIKLLEQFRELSPLMVKKTMKPLLNAIISSYPKAAQPQIPQETKSEEAEKPQQSLLSPASPLPSESKTEEEKNQESKPDEYTAATPTEDAKPILISADDAKPEEHEEKTEDKPEKTSEENHESAPSQPAGGEARDGRPTAV